MVHDVGNFTVKDLKAVLAFLCLPYLLYLTEHMKWSKDLRVTNYSAKSRASVS